MSDKYVPITLTFLLMTVSFLFLFLYINGANNNGVFEPMETINFILFLSSLVAVVISTYTWECDIEEEE